VKTTDKSVAFTANANIIYIFEFTPFSKLFLEGDIVAHQILFLN